jgi:predicted phosphoribosyltransferase
MRFRDRQEAGRRLAARLVERFGAGGGGAPGDGLVDPLVLGLPRGGLPVAFEVAQVLHAPLDVFVSRKLGAPRQPELGVGAIAEGGVRVLDGESIRMLGITVDDLDAVTRREAAELERRVARYRGGRSLPPLAGRDVVLVDDGLATGVTARAAIAALTDAGAARVILAVPVAAADTASRFRSAGVEVVTVDEPIGFGAVGYWYQRFDQTSDAEVVDLLARASAV